MTTEWNDVLERLLSLQKLDSKIRRLERELTRAPGDLKAREATVAAIDAKIKTLSDRAKVLRAQVLLRENEHKTHMAKIAKLKAQASEVRTNKEFVAFRSEIANSQGDCDRLEGEVLKILDVVEQADAKIAELETERGHELEMVDKAKAEIHEKLGDQRAALEGFQKDRPAQLEGIPKETLELYERARRARGLAMSALEGSYCSACGDMQTRNDVYAVQNRTRPILCRACNRLLYQP
jgi:predicted  nucleic acid-binding Zn-ribbon protein